MYVNAALCVGVLMETTDVDAQGINNDKSLIHLELFIASLRTDIPSTTDFGKKDELSTARFTAPSAADLVRCSSNGIVTLGR